MAAPPAADCGKSDNRPPAGRRKELTAPAMTAPTAPDRSPDQAGPLSGLLVADFSRVLAGPYATMLLADLGADVIKVESPAGDDTRHWVPPVTGDGTSTYFMAINRNKRSVALDLTNDEDLAAGQELARRADVVRGELQAGRAAPVRPGLRHGQPGQPGRRVRLDQRVRRRPGQGPARLRPHGAGHVRADEPDRRPGRAAVPGRHLGLRRDRRPAHRVRHPGRAGASRGHRPRASTSRPT